VHGELPDGNAINACPNVQVWGMNIYRGDNPGPLYNDWAARSGKPMFIAESGGDSYPDRNAPATAITRIYATVKSNLTTSSSGICAGICFFSWVDEWWKSGNNGAQDTGGFPNGGVPYDGFANEEYWGVVDIYRNAKPGYNALKTAFAGSTPPPPPSGITIVYKDCNYSGNAVGLSVGDYNYGALNTRGVANEDISSLTVNSGYEVVLYENDNFTGASIVIKSNNSCLVAQGWNDRTTSLKVRAVAPSGTSILYKDCNYSGKAVGLPVGDYNYGALYARGVANEDISSLTVNSGYEVVLYENDNFSGASIVIKSNNSCLVAQGWNDRTTSLKVRGATTSAFSTTIQAENYSAMNGVQKDATNDGGAGQYVGWIDAGDWMAYNNINI
ncbi:MAG: carbohydrate-binding protein, partial [Pedobacter sp.]